MVWSRRESARANGRDAPKWIAECGQGRERVMAVSSITGAKVSPLAAGNPQGRLRTPEQSGSEAWPDNREAMRVELSPAGRLASATSAVQTATRDSALSADFFASSEGMELLSSLLPVHRVNRRA